MPVDKEILFRLSKQKPQEPCIIKIGQNSYAVDAIEISYSEVPVTKPATRGGVYFSDKMAFRVKAKVSDFEITKDLSKTMLGPNQDFEKIQILISVGSGTTKKELKIFGNLTNYVQKSSGLELNLVVVETELSN